MFRFVCLLLLFCLLLWHSIEWLLFSLFITSDIKCIACILIVEKQQLKSRPIVTTGLTHGVSFRHELTIR